MAMKAGAIRQPGDMKLPDDVWAVVEDPNQANKPGEILKLAFDLTRYFG